MNNNFVIDDGARLFTFSNKLGEVFAEFSFNPSDTGIISRYEQVVKFFNEYNTDIDNLSDDEMVQAIEKMNEDIKAQFNVLMGKDVSSTLFKVYQPCSIFGNGDFFCEVAIQTIGQAIEQAMDVRIKEKSARIKKATAKYKKG